ncbi:hypothetical protein [Streptomyces sp. YIM S03343]
MSSKNRKGGNGPRKAEDPGRRARVAAARRQAERDQARRTLVRRTGIVAGALVLIGGVVAGAIALSNSGTGGQAASGADKIPAHPITQAKGAVADPPWAAPGNPSARADAAGLSLLGSEGEVLHIHSHLDVIVDGKAVTVPSDIGIDEAHGVSPLHTHDASGVIHIESPKKADFTLAQFMTEWNVALTAHNIGGLKAGNGKELHVYVNGKDYSGNPGAIKLGSHQEIAIVYGSAGQKTTVPGSYNFPSGE